MTVRLSKADIRMNFNRIAPELKARFKLTPNISSATVIEKTLRSSNPQIGLRGLGRPETLIGLEIGCRTLDVAKAVALSGVKHFDLLSLDIIELKKAGEIFKKVSGLETIGIFGHIDAVYFKADYDFAICRRMVYAFKSTAIETFTRLIHGNAKEAKSKRIYFFEYETERDKNRGFFAGLENGGFKITQLHPASKWHATIAQLDAIPGSVKITNPPGLYRTEFLHF